MMYQRQKRNVVARWGHRTSALACAAYRFVLATVCRNRAVEGLVFESRVMQPSRWEATSNQTLEPDETERWC